MTSVPAWYVARTKPRGERLARSSLAAERIEAYLPLIPIRAKDGEVYPAPLFPGFVFVRLAVGEAGWSRVFGARGITSVLGMSGRPSPLRSAVVVELRQREAEAFREAESVALGRWRRGDLVTLRIGGPVAPELAAVFLEPIDKRRCAVLLTLLGAEGRVAVAELAHLRSPAEACAGASRGLTRVSAGADAIGD